jgi:hypothetical protein
MRSRETWLLAETLEEFGQPEDQDAQLWAMRDYFWMLQSDVLEHAAGVWRSFRAGYCAVGTDSVPREPGRRVA